MLRSRKIIGFFARFLIAYCLLMFLWPVVCGVYGAYFRAGGDLIFGSSGSVRFQALAEPEGLDDTKFFVRKGASGKWTFTQLSSRHMGYLSTAAVLGLILATPVTWARRGRALLWGLVWLHGFIALRLGILVLYTFSVHTAGPLAVSQGFWSKSLRAGILSVSVGQGLSYIAPIIIWMLVTLRREDLGAILPKRAPHSTSSPRHGSVTARR